MSKKSIKDLFDVAQSHGPNYVDDNPRIKAGASFARYQQEFCKKFTSSYSIANRCSIFFQRQTFTKKAPLLVLVHANVPVPGQRRTF